MLSARNDWWVAMEIEMGCCADGAQVMDYTVLE